jgi:hypothetical protein
MPAIPTFTSQTPIRFTQDTAGPAFARAPDLADTGQAIANAMGRLSEGFSQVAQREKQIREADEATSLTLSGVQRLEALHEQFSRDTAPDAAERHQAAILEARREIGEGAGSSGVRRVFEGDFDRRALNTFAQARRGAAHLSLENARVSLGTNLDELARAAAGARTPDEYAATVEAARGAMAAAGANGVIGEGQADARLRRWEGQVEEQRVRRLLRDDPAAARALLSDPEALQAMDPARRAALAERTGRVGARRQRESTRDRINRVFSAVDNAFNVAAAEGMAGTDGPDPQAAMLTGNMDDDPAESAIDMLDEMRPDMDPVEYRAARRALEAPIEQSDAVFERTLLEGAHDMDPEEFRRESLRAVDEGRLTAASFQSLTAANREMHADTPQARAWRGGRSALGTSLQAPPEEAGGTLLSGPMSDARSAAVADFDAWMRRNPEANPQEASEYAAKLAETWRGASVARMRGDLPRPFRFAGAPGSIDADAVAMAEDELMAAVESGQMSPADAAREARVVGAWRWVLGPEARTTSAYQPMTFGNSEAFRLTPDPAASDRWMGGLPRERATVPMPNAATGEDMQGGRTPWIDPPRPSQTTPVSERSA